MMIKMSAHTNIIELLINLDYTKSMDGYCHGLSLRWLEACLLGREEEFFDKYINEIINNGKELIESHIARKKNQPIYFTKRQLETLAFCDSLELYQNPCKHVSLFADRLWQDNIKTISCLASADNIVSCGGLTRIYSEPGIYTKIEIQQYLDDLAAVIREVTPLSKETFGILLSGHNHVVALTYTPSSSSAIWKFMDINQYPSVSFMKTEDTNLIAERIVTGFQTSTNPYSTFHTSLFTLGNNEQLEQLKCQLDQFKSSIYQTKK